MLKSSAMPVGFGFDLHRLGSRKPLRLGGVTIPHPKGPIAHSDGDVVLHALVDALLGAVGAGDIGEHFPDSDPAWRGVSSGRFVAEALRRVRGRYRVENADLTILAESPKLGPWKAAIRKHVAKLLGVPPGRVNVKAKTMEGLGEIGKKNAIAAYAVVSLITRDLRRAK